MWIVKIIYQPHLQGFQNLEGVFRNGKPGTLKGADGKYYFLNARSLKEWMVKTFGTDPSYYKSFTEDDIDSSQTLGDFLDGHGILITIWENGNASGHADIFDGSSCPFNCHVSNSGGISHFWKLN